MTANRRNALSVLHPFRKRRPDAGSSPGVLVPGKHALTPRISVIDYDANSHDQRDITDVEELTRCLSSSTVSWIDVQGLGDESVLRRIGEIFSIHPLALKDAVNVPVRPKADTYESNQLVVARMVRMEEHTVVREQVTMIFGKNYLITFQERYGDVFDPVRHRSQHGLRMRGMGPDYLAYALLDTLIDSFYPVMEHYGDQLDRLEDQVVQDASEDLSGEIFRTRRELSALRRSMWPQRDAVSALLREESDFVDASVYPFLRDCLDHATQITDVIQGHLDLASQLMELHMSSVSNRMNEVMKVLTIMASIFIPLSFLAGVYGMNFARMPELQWPWAYPTLLGVMFAIGIGLLVAFRRRGWIGRRK